MEAVKKTDEGQEADTVFTKYLHVENLKRMPKLLEGGRDVVITEKLHGSNCRVGNLYGKIKVGSRNGTIYCDGNYNVMYDPFKFHEWLVNRYGLDTLSRIIPDGAILYGEFVGNGVQRDLKYYNDDAERHWYIFDVRYQGRYLPFDERVAFLAKLTDNGKPLFEQVPVLHRGRMTTELINALRDAPSSIGASIREGIMITPVEEFHLANGNRAMAKYKNPKFDEGTAVITRDLKTESQWFKEGEKYCTEARVAGCIEKLRQLTHTVDITDMSSLTKIMKADVWQDLDEEERRLVKESGKEKEFYRGTCYRMAQYVNEWVKRNASR